ncbi:MAG: ATP-binding cassette domain-containing protein [Candidatus Hodarchaeales archaeon]|jgi:putative ABC transport system ATP-binding protein
MKNHHGDNLNGSDLSDLSIDVRNIEKIYGMGDIAIKAVDNISLHLVNKEIVLIMGPSGSGKSTFVQLIAGLLSPTKGKVFYGDKEITNFSLSKKAKFRIENMGFIFQSPNLISSLTAMQNVELVLNLNGIKGKKAKQIATEKLTELGMEKRLHHKPKSLSGGEQQRVSIARALANDPPVIIADEPTASLDSKNGLKVMEILQSIAKTKEKTVVIVTHDYRIREFADRVFWLEDGKINLRYAKGEFIDPVCFMNLDIAEFVFNHTFEEKDYKFCSEDCLNEFNSDQDYYLSRIPAGN